jgi:SAM-dependent methyltransferase
MSETLQVHRFDAGKAEAFAGRLLNALNEAAFCLMASIGHRTGLFDRMRDQPPMTSEELAAHAGLHERYVREWLGAMVTAGVVNVDPQSVRYQLPPEHAAALTREAAANNLAAFAQYVPLLGSVEDDIVACFKNGGGVSYERFPRFHAVMAEDSGASVLSSLESHILPLVPGLADRLERGARALDAGCGSGRVLNRLAGLFPKSHFVGMDFSKDALRTAGAEASAEGLKNVEFQEVDLSDFDRTAPPESFDLITTFDAVHDQGKPLNVLKGIAQHRPPDRDLPLHRVVPALHDRVAGPGGRGTRRDVGRGKDAGVSRESRLPIHREARAGPRHPEQLVRRQEMRRDFRTTRSSSPETR